MTETCQKMERPVLGRNVFVSRPWKERVKGCLSAKDALGGGDGGYWKFRFWFKPEKRGVQDSADILPLYERVRYEWMKE